MERARAGRGRAADFAAVIRHRVAWFVANFCLLANGTYLAAAWFSGDEYLDTPQLLEAGSWPAAIAVYCLVTIGFGYFGLRRSVIGLLQVQTCNKPADVKGHSGDGGGGISSVEEFGD